MAKVTKKEVEDAWDEVQGKSPPKKNSALAMMVADADKPAELPDIEKMTVLTKHVEKAKWLKKEKERLEKLAADAGKELNEILSKTIPDIFDELGLKEFTMKDGSHVNVKQEFVANIIADNKEKAYDWLKKNGHGDIIKQEITVSLGKGNDELYEDVKQDLELLGVNYEDKEDVHWQTMKAFINEIMKQPDNKLPQEVFGVYPVRVTKIKEK